MDPAALRRLDLADIERVAYTCQLSGKEEEVLLVGDQLASRLAEVLPEAEDANGARILIEPAECLPVSNPYRITSYNVCYTKLLR